APRRPLGPRPRGVARPPAQRRPAHLERRRRHPRAAGARRV
ncbi:MAG: hypothetical protein AVDCRST_MAG54-4088, partial [uncultured Actinomycetospora sp.]